MESISIFGQARAVYYIRATHLAVYNIRTARLAVYNIQTVYNIRTIC